MRDGGGGGQDTVMRRNDDDICSLVRRVVGPAGVIRQ